MSIVGKGLVKMRIIFSAVLMLLIVLAVGVCLWLYDNDDDNWGNFV